MSPSGRFILYLQDCYYCQFTEIFFFSECGKVGLNLDIFINKRGACCENDQSILENYRS